MWTLVEPDNTADRHDGAPPDTLASRLPDFDDPDISAALAVPEHRQRPLWRILAYALSGLLLTAALIGQIGYRHLDRISQHDASRPWLATVCEAAGCVLPARQDSTLIVSNRLAIEPHPDYQNASRMTLSFTNTADFAQPMPTIELVYSDIQGREVAGRRFSPQLYLTGPETGVMPAGASLTAQLDFADPAADAVNYQVRFIYE